MDLINKNTITSLELLEQINIFRKQEGGRAELQHRDLLKVIRDEFKEEIDEGKISPVTYKDKKGEERPMFELTTEQAKQVLVRESKFVRKAVIHYIKELENKLKDISSNTQQQRLYERSPQELLSDNAIALNKMFETLKLNIPKEIIISTAIHETKNAIGYDFPEVQKLLIKVDNEDYHSSSALLKQLNIKRNRTNETLVLLGLQVKGTTSMQPYLLTELGRKYGVERSYNNGGHQGYEIKYKPSLLDYIKNHINEIPSEWIK